MQTVNSNVQVTITARHMSVTDAMRAHAMKKIEGLHLDYPKIIEAKVILDVENYRHIAEVILVCANHIHIEAKTETDDLYASIDETVSKIARRMRKHKTRLLKKHRARGGDIRHLEEQVYTADVFEKAETESEENLEPCIVHKESYKIRPLFPDEAIMDLELSERSFIAFHNAKTDRFTILFRRPDGDYGMIEPVDTYAS